MFRKLVAFSTSISAVDPVWLAPGISHETAIASRIQPLLIDPPEIRERLLLMIGYEDQYGSSGSGSAMLLILRLGCGGRGDLTCGPRDPPCSSSSDSNT
jgi:hypothetical protein